MQLIQSVEASHLHLMDGVSLQQQDLQTVSNRLSDAAIDQHIDSVEAEIDNSQTHRFVERREIRKSIDPVEGKIDFHQSMHFPDRVRWT